MPPRPPTLRPRAVGTADNPFLVDENGRVVMTLTPRRTRKTAPLRPARQQHASAEPARIRQQHRRHPRGNGSRAKRDKPLTDHDLYIDDVRPPILTTDRPHHECSVCFHIKSHPITYECGHGSCYVCARKWLEYQWTCPTCRALVTRAPSRNFDAEAAILYDHPHWDDRSLVTFSWDGLKFPQMPVAP
ncbi:hypothetical protein B0H11DRAFT_1909733 [Mycena galericulata]|nr:hypothetical protein B0H11DRAFT_2262788 [Mycena galericulata]KAJ7498214.1 hypothetical protein B0H11DRAFT_1909733 [Mycena galericulata]